MQRMLQRFPCRHIRYCTGADTARYLWFNNFNQAANQLCYLAISLIKKVFI